MQFDSFHNDEFNASETLPLILTLSEDKGIFFFFFLIKRFLTYNNDTLIAPTGPPTVLEITMFSSRPTK